MFIQNINIESNQFIKKIFLKWRKFISEKFVYLIIDLKLKYI